MLSNSKATLERLSYSFLSYRASAYFLSTTMKSIFAGIFLILMLILVILSLLRQLENFTPKIRRHDFPGTMSDKLRRDCDNETVYSMESSHCDEVCQRTGIFESKKGVCVNQTIFTMANERKRCDLKRGVVAYLTGNSEFGTIKSVCMSLDIGISPEDPDKPNNLCSKGQIEIDYRESFPQMRNCKCPNDQHLVIIPSTRIIRSHGICVDSGNNPLIKFNDLLYNEKNYIK
ncbi:pif-3 [Fopius arisanus]|nr:pif-3 [Fopius arisanus]